MKWMTKTSMIAAVAFAVVVGFTAGLPGRAESADDVTKAKLASINSIAATGEGNSVELAIKLSSPVTYTSYKTTAPLRLIIDLSQATQGTINVPLAVNKGNFKTVAVNRYDTDAGVLTRIAIELVNDSEAVIAASAANPGELRISFPAITETIPPTAVERADTSKPIEKETTASSPAAVPEPTKSAPGNVPSTLTSITANKKSIFLNIDGAIGDFKVFRLTKPERYVVDLMDVKSGLETRLLPLNVAGVTSARIGLHPDKTRVVFDSVNDVFPDASAVKSDSAVVINIGAKPANDNPGIVMPSESADAPTMKSTKASKSSGPVSVEMIDFQVLDGISRVSVKVKGDVVVDQPVKSAGFVTLTLRNTLLSKRLQRSLDTRSFVSPVLRVTPLMVKTKKGSDTKIKIAMRADASFDYRQEGDMLFVDFKNPEGLTADRLAAETVDRKPQASASIAKASASQDAADISTELTQPQAIDSMAKASGTSRVYSGRKVTLEFADADVRKIFQLLSEVSGKNFVLGDDVTGNISIKLVNVPWDQALEIILDTKELDKRDSGNVLTIKKKGKFGTQESADAEAKKIVEKNLPLQPAKVFSVNYSTLTEVTSQIEKLSSGEKGSKLRTDSSVISDSRTNKIIVVDTLDRLTLMQNLLSEIDVPEKQVMIEARIVEATSTFTRSLGVHWGLNYTGNALPLLGVKQLDTSFGGMTSTDPTSGVSGTPGGSMGISFGTLGSNISLDLRLNAAASAGMIKIISSPKVATLNHKTAKISQGQQIPYQNTTATTGAVTAFVAATLSLEVTPHINANGTIVMKIDAKNDAPGTGSPPPINTKSATTELLLKDGETTVIGGIFVDSDTDGDDGVPYLMDIPFFGKLFKSSSKSKSKTELLIFITPRILSGIS